MKTTEKSIRSVLNDIKANQFILPALQREFVWKRRDIENLFDSLLQGFPINTMMFWTVNDIKKESMEFYQFLDPDFKESQSLNKLYPVRDNERKTIVIDGQQRLTSLYVAIYGSYTLEKGKNKMYLYLSLDKKLPSDESEDASLNSTENYYNFKFLTDSKVKSLEAAGEHWIKVSDAYASNFNPPTYLNNKHLNENNFARDTLQKLYMLFQSNEVLNAYEITDGDLEKVLNIFVRTNSGGKPLTKGDLLLSVITVNWSGSNQENARQFVVDIVKKVSDGGYKVDKDWVLGCILYILNKDVKLNVNNFDKTVSSEIYNNKENISKSIVAACNLLNRYGMQERGLTTKLALLPIIYHIYKYKLADTISKAYVNGQLKSVESGIYVQMRTWLFRAIVTNLFEAGTSDILKKIQGIQQTKGDKDNFPIVEIINQIDKLKVDDTLIENLIETEKKAAFPVLNIIYSSTSAKSYLKPNTDYDIDHIHAQVNFNPADGDTRYNTIPNLQLLTYDENRSKNAMTLSDWWTKKTLGQKEDYLLPYPFKTDIADFNDFFDTRKTWLSSILAEKLDASCSKYAGISYNEKVIAAVYREQKDKYSLSWNMHANKELQLNLPNGQEISILPKNILELQGLNEQQKQDLEGKGLTKEWFVETTDKWNNKVIRETEYGIELNDNNIESSKLKVQKVLEYLFQ